MSVRRSVGLVSVLALVAVLLVPVSAASPARSAAMTVAPAPVGSLSAHSAPSVAAASAGVARLKSALTRDGIPANEQLVPAAASGVTVRDGTITPSYSTVPAPMGIGYYGTRDVNGRNVGTISYAPSVEGVLSLNSLNLLYMQSAGPDEYTSQLNAVLTGVTVHDTPNLQFWCQNVIYYFQSDHTLHLASAIVNFSSPSLNFSANTIVKGNGYYAPGFGYFNPYGGAIVAAEPFTIRFYLNSTVANNEPAVYFNYSLTQSNGRTTAGSYDLVEFNSTLSGVAKHPAPRPAYQINGKALGGTGFIPNDVELMLGGDGGGSLLQVFNIDATMQLFTLANGSRVYSPVPSAYDFGSETGETSVGIAEWASGGPDPTVHLGPGPSIQMPLWGVAGAAGFGRVAQTLRLSPSNAFVFVARGSSFDANAASWAPVPGDGTATYWLAPGTYSYDVLLAERAPAMFTLTGYWTKTVTLASDPALGVYTPLWAFGNAQLAAISQPGGAGTLAKPYTLLNAPAVQNPLFGEFNDYLFPVFEGIWLVGTTDYVSVYRAPAFEVPYSLSWETGIGTILPLTNQLGLALYQADHVSFVSDPDIGGWVYASGAAGESGADLILWNSSDDLVAGDSFQVASRAIYAFGGTNNVLWGNAFTTSLPSAPNPGAIANYGNPLALELFESGDLVFNNAFVTPQTAITPPYNPYDFFLVTVLWHDRWNVPVQPAGTAFVVNGWTLTGSVLGLSYVAGNYWSNYGTPSNPYGVLPYNNSGQIVVRGDYHPLVPFPLYAITITETGLPKGTAWSVRIAGDTETTTATVLRFFEPAGTYAFVVGAVRGWVAHPASGAIVLSHGTGLSIHWTKS